MVHTGDGKGKTTAALGLALRAWGAGLRVLILQFIKSDRETGEKKAIERLTALDGLCGLDDSDDVPDAGNGGRMGHIELRSCGLGFARRDSEHFAKHRQAALDALAMAREEMLSGQWDMLILDEINYAMRGGLLTPEEVLALLDARPASMHLVLTGRGVPDKIAARADLITEMKLVRHPYQQGIQAQRGIEF